MGEGGSVDVLDGIARQAFGRINTSIAITMASYITGFLSHRMPRAELVLVSTVVFVALVLFRRHGGSAAAAAMQPLVTAKSVMGIVISTTIMQSISNIGSALSAAQPARGAGGQAGIQGMFASPNMLLLLHDVHNPHLPAIILGTSFVLLSGAMPRAFRATEEGTAMYMGVQYAYSDIVMATLPDTRLRRAITLAVVVLLPTTSRRMQAYTESSGPLATLLSALLFTAVGLVIDASMPQVVGNTGEDIVRGVAVVLLVHALLDPARAHDPFSSDVAPFALWRVARRFSGMFEQYGLLQAGVLLGVGLGILRAARPLVGGMVVGVVHDLLVLISVYLLSAAVLHGAQRGSTGDAIILMLSGMATARTLMALVTQHMHGARGRQ